MEWHRKQRGRKDFPEHSSVSPILHQPFSKHWTFPQQNCLCFLFLSRRERRAMVYSPLACQNSGKLTWAQPELTGGGCLCILTRHGSAWMWGQIPNSPSETWESEHTTGAQKATGLWGVVRSKAGLTLSVAKVKGKLGGHFLWSLHESLPGIFLRGQHRSVAASNVCRPLS